MKISLFSRSFNSTYNNIKSHFPSLCSSNTETGRCFGRNEASLLEFGVTRRAAPLNVKHVTLIIPAVTVT